VDGEEVHPGVEYSILKFQCETFCDCGFFIKPLTFKRQLVESQSGREKSCREHHAGVSFAGLVSHPIDGGTLMMKIRAGKVCAVLVGIVALAVAASSQEKKVSTEAHKIVHFGDLKWTPIIKGCDIAVVEGNPDAEGQPFVIRFRCADGAKVPAHWHPTDENLTVLKGAFLVGTGDTFDESKLQTMNVGNFLMMPKEMHHFASNKGETILQVHGMGPFKVNWVNPSEVQQPDAPAPAAKPKS